MQVHDRVYRRSRSASKYSPSIENFKLIVPEIAVENLTALPPAIENVWKNVACVAHDLGNLLQGILLQTSLARRSVSPDEDVGERLRHVDELVRHASELLGELQGGSAVIESQAPKFDLCAVVHDSLRPIVTSLAEGIKIEYESALSTIAVPGDASLMRRIVINLVNNAIEAIGCQSGRINIRTGCVTMPTSHSESEIERGGFSETQCVYLEVEDSGKGMNQKTMKKIFEPYYSTKGSGRGIGLASVQEAVKTLGGSVRVSSSPRWGTIFRILLPRS